MLEPQPLTNSETQKPTITFLVTGESGRLARWLRLIPPPAGRGGDDAASLQAAAGRSAWVGMGSVAMGNRRCGGRAAPGSPQ